MAYHMSAYHLTLQIYFHFVHSMHLIYKLYQHQQMYNSIYFMYFTIHFLSQVLA
jgi:hypothetical protein